MKYKRCILLVLLQVALAVCMSGCGMHGQGETAAEGSRRHRRILDNNTQQLADDIDMVLMLDKPSKLSELRVK